MIKLSNGYDLEYVIASGALGFGEGWLWERPLIALGLIKPELFAVGIKTLTRRSRPGNLRWWKPWTCVCLIPGGSVNKIGLTNPGIEWWLKKVAPHLNFRKISFIGSIFGEENELVEMAKIFNDIDIIAIEVNPSCPNTSHAMQTAETVVKNVKAVKEVSRHPIIVKVSVNQDYLAIARGLRGTAEAISLNSVPYETAFPNGEKSPLWKLEKRVGGGGGGVSGKPAQKFNWAAVKALAEQGLLPVIGPSIMEYDDMDHVRSLGAEAVSFGAIHLPTEGSLLKLLMTFLINPCKSTAFVRKETGK